MERIRNCEICGKPYRPIKANQKYCPVCKSKKYKQIIPRIVKCAICGKEFTTILYNKKYCSKKCRDISKLDMSRQVVKVCAICGKEFETTRKEKIYCSRSCAIKAKAEKDKLWREANAGKC